VRPPPPPPHCHPRPRSRCALRCRGFTKFNAADYEEWKSAGRIVPDGVNAKLLDNKGSLAARKPERLFLKPATVLRRAVHDEEEE